MKNKKLLLLSLISILSFSLASCNENKGSTDKKTMTATIDDSKKLVVKSGPKNINYYQYEKFSTEGLVIALDIYQDDKIINTIDIDDYTLSLKDGTELKDGDFIMDVGDLEITVKKDNYQTSFIIHVQAARALHQSITITKAPDKISYLAGDAFSREGLEVTLKTRTSGKYTRTYTQIVDDLYFKIGDTIIDDSFRFEGAGVFKVYVCYTGWDKTEVTTYYTVTCIPENNVSTPKKYVDNTITWDTDNTNLTVEIKNTNSKNTEGKGYYSPDEVINEYNIDDYSKKNVANWKFTPSKGEVPLLVIPIITPGDEKLATEHNWNMINKAFFGDSTSLNFESVHSYYYKSSFGQLDIKGGTTGYFSPATVDSSYNTMSGYNEDGVFNLPQLALNWAEKEYNINLADYDSNHDGYVDGIWFIYLHSASSTNSMTWAFTSSTNAVNNDVSTKPIANCFGWASIDFINDNFSSRYSPSFENKECDAHVLIHETGHMLGLKDYYSYAGNSTNYAPLGKADMMDNNVGDQNPYSKLYLNWVTPYIVYGDCTITIPSSQAKNSLIIIPNDEKEFKKNSDGKVLFNTMDEYLVLDYYTDKNLNASDYDCYDVKHIEGSGARIYHVDNRVVNVAKDEKNNQYHYSLYSDPMTPFEEGNTDTIYKVISNSETGSRAESNYTGMPSEADAFDEIRLISQDGNLLSTTNVASTAALFKQGDTFSLEQYKSQFNKTKVVENNKTTYLTQFNNHLPCSYTISITSIK